MKKKRELIEVVPAWERKCRWMEVGVISYKLCTRNYDCASCPLDQALTEELGPDISQAPAKPGEYLSEERRAEFLSLPGETRKCRHMLTGEVSFRLCVNSFKCASCEFHQMMVDRPGVDFPMMEEELAWVAGYQVPLYLYFHRGHAWARVEYEGIVRVGIDDFASKLVGPSERIMLPRVGERIQQGVITLEMRHNGHRARLRSPVDGMVLAVNQNIEAPNREISDPYGKDWMFLVKPINLKENLESLLYGYYARAWIDHEAETLFSILQAELGPIAMKGGVVRPDLWKKISTPEWETLLRRFLLS
jgi:glycine cleavage system H lipoate-binding protein